MKYRRSGFAHILVLTALLICVGGSKASSERFVMQESRKETRMAKRATGTFEVKLTPQDDKSAEGLGRMTIAKQVHGDLEGTSTGQMLTSMTKTQGSAAYVAIERVTGTLHGRTGSFDLHHLGIMNRGTQQLTITVVPDSGTDQLTGITGTMTIKISDGKHSYEFDYSLPAGP
jgi:Protein of unknown function (DUF3224)